MKVALCAGRVGLINVCSSVAVGSSVGAFLVASFNFKRFCCRIRFSSEISFQIDVPLHVASRYNGLAIDSPISPQRHTPDTLAGLVHYTYVLSVRIFGRVVFLYLTKGDVMRCDFCFCCFIIRRRLSFLVWSMVCWLFSLALTDCSRNRNQI